MFEDKLEKADNEFGLFEILRCIREVYGIDSELEIVDEDRIGVIFSLKDKEHFTVIVTDKLNREDLIYYNPEFGVTDDIDQAIDRLIDLIK